MLSALLARFLMGPLLRNSAPPPTPMQGVIGRDHYMGVGTPKIRRGGSTGKACGPNGVL